MSEANMGRSIDSQDSYLNRAFLIVEHTSIRPDWVSIRSKLNLAFSKANNDPAISFNDWLSQVKENISTVIDINEGNSKLHDVSRNSDQEALASNMVSWLSGEITEKSMLEGYPYEDKVTGLSNIRQKNGAFSPKALADLRNDYDSHQYWFHYIKKYESLPDDKIRPPIPGARKPGINRASLELVHELDGLLNIILTIMPKFEFELLKYNVRESDLESMLNAYPKEPSCFSEFKSWIFQNEFLAKRIEKSFNLADRENIYNQAVFLWLSIQWIKQSSQCGWEDALKLAYQGKKLEELFLALIESCLKSQTIRHQLRKCGAVKSEEYQELLRSSAHNISCFVGANYLIVEQEVANAGNSQSEYEKRFGLVVGFAVLDRTDKVVGAINKHLKSENTIELTRKKYTRVGKSKALGERMLPLIFYFSDMNARYHHWFRSKEEKGRALGIVDEKVDYSSAESGKEKKTLLESAVQEYFVDEVEQLLFSFSDSIKDIANYKNNLACIIAFHRYEEYFSRKIEELPCKLAIQSMDAASLSCELAIEAYATKEDLNIENISLVQVETALSALEEQFPNKGFSNLVKDVLTLLNKIPAVIDTVKKKKD